MSVLPHLEVLSVSTTASSPNATANNVDLTAAPLMLKKGDWLIGPGICIPIKSLTKSGVNTVIELEWGAPATLSTTRMLIYRVDDSSRLLDAQTQMLVALASNMVTAMKSLTPAANKFPYFDAAGAAQLGDITAFARTLLDDAGAAAARNTLGIVSGSATSAALRGVFTPAGFATADLTPAEVRTLIGNVYGFYKIAGADGAAVQFPPGFPVTHGVIEGYSNNNNSYGYSYQKLYTLWGGHAREYMRKALNASAWSPWYEVYNQYNIRGTVSQSGGVPTGAIVERGSNANGEYVKFADGTQICRQTLPPADTNVASGVLFQNSGSTISWTFPAAFAAAPNLSGDGNSTGRWLCLTSSGSGLTSVELRVFSPVQSSLTVSPKVLAIGRWF